MRLVAHPLAALLRQSNRSGLIQFAAGLGDRYLARTGYDSQMTEEPAASNRPNNLWRPLPGDHGAQGEFGNRASARSLQLWATTHRSLLATAVIGAAVLGYLWRNGKRQCKLGRKRRGDAQAS